MNELLSKIILDNSVKHLLTALLVILLVFIFKRYLSRYFAGLIFRIISVFTRNVERKEFVGLVVVPLEIFLLIITVIVTLDKLYFPQQLDFEIYHISSRQLMDAGARGILIITFNWFLLKNIDFVALVLKKKAARTADPTDDQLILFFKDFFKAMIIILGILLVLRFVFNYNISSLITGLSIATAAIALATKESLENLIASFIIFFDKPFTAGDWVKVQSVSGTIERIGLRSTRIRTEQKTFVTVPNKQMVDSIVDNYTLRTQRKGELLLVFSAEASPEQIRQFVSGAQQLLEKQAAIETSAVYFADIVKNTCVIKGEYFTNPIEIHSFNELKAEINLQLLELALQCKLRLASGDQG